MCRLSATRFPSGIVVALLAAVLFAVPALADEAKARAHLDRARELQESGGTDVARWLRELRTARQALKGVEEGPRAELLGEIEATLDAGMERHLSKARELVSTPGGLRRADLYYLQPAERALKDYAEGATRARYGAVIEALRQQGQASERLAAEERERAAEERERAAEERERAAEERRERAAEERRRRATPPPEVEAPDATPEEGPSEEPTSGARTEPEALDRESGAAGSTPDPGPEQSVAAVVLAVLAFLVVSILMLAVGGWAAFYALREVRAGNAGGVAAVAFGGFGGLIALIGVGVAFEEPLGGLATVVFGLVFVGVGLLARKLFQTPEGKREVVASRHTAEVRTLEGLPAQRVQEHRVLVDADASEAEVAAAQRDWKRSLWRRRPDWVAGSIEEDAVRHAGLAPCGAAMWLVFSLGLAGGWWFSGDGMIGLAAGGTGLVALGFAAVAVRTKLHRRKFGASRLVLASSPLFLGERLQGVLHTGVERQLHPVDGFRLRLRCFHSYEQTGTQDRNSVRRRDVLWEREVSVSGRDSSEKPGRLDVEVDLELPADKDETSTIGRDGILWELELHADLPGLDYRATFELPVFRRDEEAWLPQP